MGRLTQSRNRSSDERLTDVVRGIDAVEAEGPAEMTLAHEGNRTTRSWRFDRTGNGSAHTHPIEPLVSPGVVNF
ncbi:hypothetical protein D8S78_00440 [Natrialba swarupiae]|nr:hypothetical protein [Natrialba swarupiae]